MLVVLIHQVIFFFNEVDWDCIEKLCQSKSAVIIHENTFTYKFGLNC